MVSVGLLRASYRGWPFRDGQREADTEREDPLLKHTNTVMSLAGRWSLIYAPQQLPFFKAQSAAQNRIKAAKT